jgi:NADPH-dependent 2,4-dienoyl-CoA reductase/sulfur reductase-like enzyme
MLANPDLVQMLQTGRLDDLKPCIGCGRCIDNQLMHEQAIMCSLNPSVGHEIDKFIINRASSPKKVLVVGGGPAGMETAIIAAKRGHAVTLFEREQRLGGQLNQAIIPPHKRNLVPLIAYFQHQLRQSGVTYNLNHEVIVNEVLRERPDVVIIATGVTFTRPPIPGIHNANVINAKSVLNGQKVGKKVVILGGGLVGCETAEFLGLKGKKVTILEMLPDLAGKMVATHRVLLLERLKHLGVKTVTSAKCTEIRGNQVFYVDRTNQPHILEADNVLLAVGEKPNLILAKELEKAVPKIYLVGDCVKPEGIGECIAAGYKIALDIE